MRFRRIRLKFLWLFGLIAITVYICGVYRIYIHTRKHFNGLFLKMEDVSAHNEKGFPLPRLYVKSAQKRTVIWAVLAGRKLGALERLLHSLRGMGTILVAKGQDSESIGSSLEKYRATLLSTPDDCNKTTAVSEICIKNNWLWLMRSAWSLEPDVVCFTTEEFILSPHAKFFVEKYAANEQYGMKLSSGFFTIPWCFGRNVWDQIKKNQDLFYSLEQHGWEDAVAHILNKSRSQISTSILSMDLALNVSDCNFRAGITNDCLEKMASFNAETQVGSKRRKQDRLVQNQTFTLAEQAQRHGKMCKRFQFQQTSDDRVYSNPTDSKGAKSYIIDLGPTCINTLKIRVSKGGEDVADVIGRKENAEFPFYEKGSFQIYERIPTVETNLYQKEILRSAVLMNKRPSAYDFPGSTIAYMRYDYANLCFALNDWFNLYLTLEHAPSNRILWLDGHASGNFDNVTSDLFDIRVMRIGHMSGVKCFERLILQPKEYVLYYAKKTKYCDVKYFVEMMWKKYNITAGAEKHDTVIIRDYYLAHPRVTKEVTRKFSDDELEDIRKKLPGAKFVRFHEFSWKEQLQIIANTKTLYGMHGAGLTLGLFLDKGASMLEWIHASRSDTFTFLNLMTWRPDVNFRRLYLKEWLKE